jgi:hypothetical protein
MDTNEAGKPTRQHWAITSGGTATVDFLIQPSRAGDKGGKLRHIEPDFAAIIVPGLSCAFRDRIAFFIAGCLHGWSQFAPFGEEVQELGAQLDGPNCSAARNRVEPRRVVQ